MTDAAHEAVARAICDTEWGGGYFKSAECSDNERAAYRAMASAAIAAYRASPAGAAADKAQALEAARLWFVHHPPFNALEVLTQLNRMKGAAYAVD